MEDWAIYTVELLEAKREFIRGRMTASIKNCHMSLIMSETAGKAKALAKITGQGPRIC